MIDASERPESLLTHRWPSAGTWAIGLLFAVGAHLLLPAFLVASQWLLVVLGLAIPVEERERPSLPDNIVAAEFVRLGKPLDPKKLPNRKVPPIAKRTPDGVVVSKDAKEPQEKKKKEEKEKPADFQEDLLDNYPVIKKSIILRNPYTDVLNLLQVELIRRLRRTDDESAREELRNTVFLSINGIAAALQSTG